MIPPPTVHEAAKRDLRGHVRYIAGDNPKAARRFLKSVEQAFDLLRRTPLIGAPCEFLDPAAAGLRYWIVKNFKNYLIVYRPVEEDGTIKGIDVVRIFHAAQDWQAAFEE